MTAISPVLILMDIDCGHRAERLAEFAHVWLVGSEANCESAHAYWARRESIPDAGASGSLTTFTARGTSAEEQAESVIESVDERHNHLATNGPYTSLIVEGAGLTPPIYRSLLEKGFVRIEEAQSGFHATK